MSLTTIPAIRAATAGSTAVEASDIAKDPAERGAYDGGLPCHLTRQQRDDVALINRGVVVGERRRVPLRPAAPTQIWREHSIIRGQVLRKLHEIA